MSEIFQNLIEAENKALLLFQEIEKRGLIQVGKSEKILNKEVFLLAQEMLGIKKFWHKRIVRSGENTLLPYKHNPPDLILKENDILFFDFGPVFEDFEADIGKTVVIGNDPLKKKLASDVELAWKEGLAFYLENKENLTGARMYQFTKDLAKKYGWEYGNEHCGHLVGNFPHEKLLGEEKINYLHPENKELLSNKDKFGKERYWIYEIHFVDYENKIGGFFEQLLYNVN
jgi:Xaa-Pro dipeptidase